MREIKEVREIEELKGYEAIDGTKFYIHRYVSEQEAQTQCETYEKSAEGVINARVREFMIGEGSNYDIDPMNMNDDPVEIFKIENQNQLDALNMYIRKNLSEDYQKIHLDEKYVGKEIIIQWNYEKDWCVTYTYEEYLEKFKNNYYEMIERYKNEKS